MLWIFTYLFFTERSTMQTAQVHKYKIFFSRETSVQYTVLILSPDDIYIYIYIGFEPMTSYLPHTFLTAELSGQTIRCAQWSTRSSDHEVQVIAR